MKKKGKIFLYSFITIALLLTLTGAVFFFTSYSKYKEVSFNPETFETVKLSIPIYDSENKRIKDENRFNSSYIKLDSLPNYVKESFISIEDKDFYNHNGLNYKRILKAAFENIRSLGIKEGASTISQQLIKNTHLSNERTFSRKLKEISLTKQLENRYSKDEILENYLNIIYFGNNCYGIEQAANYYFSKPAKNLTVAQAATLAGMIKSPKNFSPLLNASACIKRRNLVLSEMQKDGKLDNQTAEKAKKEELNLILNTKGVNKLNSYSEAVLDEAMGILKMPAKQIAIGGYKIYTYQDEKRQQALNETLEEGFDGNNYAGIIIDPKNHAVTAYLGSSDYKILDKKRQVGSTIKPVLVYGPALNENIISPSTQILDEKIDIAGYSPKNSNGKYVGYVSAKEALAKSINIPAIKILSYVGLEKAKAYATRLGIDFDETDNNYAIALGGMTHGTNLLSITNAYTSFANEGKYADAKFISYIQNKDGKIVYRHVPESRQIFRSDTAYLITDMLKETVKSGTAKKLSNLPFEVASKTGTVGNNNGENIDAYNISYTTEDVCGIWVGNMDNTPIEIKSGNEPTIAVSNILNSIYENKKPQPFSRPSSIREVEIDLLELNENHQVVKANDYTPDRYKTTEVFSSFNTPKETSRNYLVIEPAVLEGKVVGEEATLYFNANEIMQYELYRIEKGRRVLIKTFSKENGYVEFKDKLDDRIVSYELVTKIKNYATGKELFADPSKITLLKK